MANPPIRHVEDRDGQEYDLVAVVPGIDVETTTLAEGADATGSAEVDGQTGHVTLHVGIPRGDTGARGDKGDTGDAGRDGVDGTTGPKGDKGDKGDTGTSVTGVTFDSDGGLTISMSDGTSAEYGGITTAVKAAQDAAEGAQQQADDAKSAAASADAAAAKATSDVAASIKAANDAEGKRAAAESERATAEAARADAETKRETADTDRETRIAAAEKTVGGFDGRLATVESAIGTGIQQLEPAQIQSIVKSSNAARYFPVGTQLTVPWTYDGEQYDFVWDVVHHYDGSDDAHPLRLMADGTSKPAMQLQAHYCLPIETQYGSREAAYAAQSDMPAGTYHLAINITVKWAGAPGIAGTVGTRQYQFTTTKAHPAGAQFVWEQGESAQISSAKVYDVPMGTEVSETVAITETDSPTGTDLGTMSENSSDAGLNNPQRTIYGNNNWARSSLRLFLNDTSDAYKDTLVTPWHRAASYSGKAGVLGGFSEDFRAVLGEVTNYTQPHPFDGDSAEETHDTLFLASAREHGLSNYLINTADGYAKEGVPWDYWTQLAKANGISDGIWRGWQTYPALTTYDLANHTQARSCWERSAYRNVTSAFSAGNVYASGSVAGGNGFLNNGSGAVLSACIV